MKEVFVNLLLLSVTLMVGANFTSSCPKDCDCFVGIDDEKTVDCRYEVDEIPKKLSNETHVLNLSFNNLIKIPNYTFQNVTLNNLTTLNLKRCNLETIEENGLSGLPALRFLDLSHNTLKVLGAGTFKELVKIEMIDLNNNQIQRLENELFNNLKFLRYVDLSYNKIERIEEHAFINVSLQTVLLESNRLKYLKKSILSDLRTTDLSLGANPWRCDCELKPFIEWVVSVMHIVRDPSSLECRKPAELTNMYWTELNLNCTTHSTTLTAQPSTTTSTIIAQVSSTTVVPTGGATSIMIQTSSLVLLLCSLINAIY